MEPRTLSSALERICFLEWRLEQMESVLADERHTIRDLREQLAEAASREADGARKQAELEHRLADAKREMVSLGDRTAHADAERSALARRMEAAGQETSKEIAELCLQLEAEKGRAEAKERALSQARARLALLERSREGFFSKLIEWQQLSREDDVDLAEFIAELRSEIMSLARQNEAAAEREESLREQLLDANVEVAPEPESPPPLFLAGAPKSTPPRPAIKGTAIGFDEARSVLDEIERPSRRTRAQRLLSELSGGREDTRLAAARGLVEAARERSAPALAAALALATSLRERVELLRLLGRSRSELALAAIKTAIGDDDPLVRAAAVEAALELPIDPLPLAQQGLEDRDARVRRRTVLALASSKIDSAPLLLPMLQDEDAQTRRAVCAAIGRAPTAQRALVDTLSDEAPQVRAAAARALSETMGEDLSKVAEMPPLLRRRAIGSLRQRVTEVSGGAS